MLLCRPLDTTRPTAHTPHPEHRGPLVNDGFNECRTKKSTTEAVLRLSDWATRWPWNRLKWREARDGRAARDRRTKITFPDADDEYLRSLEGCRLLRRYSGLLYCDFIVSLCPESQRSVRYFIALSIRQFYLAGDIAGVCSLNHFLGAVTFDDCFITGTEQLSSRSFYSG